MAKRLLDLAIAGLALLLLLPVLACVATLVRILNGSPVLFRQTRVGRSSRDFMLLKFRTMTVQRGSENGTFDAGSSARVTNLGAVLRRTKLDELPQLWNVLRGEMSLVGPRPEVRRWVEVYPSRWSAVLAVRPGMTDPASIEYRNEESLLAAATDPEAVYRDEILPRKLDLYEQYLREQSLAGDLFVLARTVVAVIGR